MIELGKIAKAVRKLNFILNFPSGFDWAVVFKGQKKIYFVAETKSAGRELRGSEQMKMKIECGKQHFREFEDVKFEQVIKVQDLR